MVWVDYKNNINYICLVPNCLVRVIICRFVLRIVHSTIELFQVSSLGFIFLFLNLNFRFPANLLLDLVILVLFSIILLFVGELISRLITRTSLDFCGRPCMRIVFRGFRLLMLFSFVRLDCLTSWRRGRRLSICLWLILSIIHSRRWRRFGNDVV